MSESNSVRLPIDLTQLPQFLRLTQAFGFSKERAVLFWFTLWQQLAYQAQEGKPLGIFPKSALPEFVAALELNGIVERVAEDEQMLNKLVDVGLLARQGETEYFCARYKALHQGFADKTEMSRRGGEMKWARRRQEQIDKNGSIGDLLVMDPARFKDQSGKDLDSNEKQQVMWLIRTIDNALQMPERILPNFTEGLIAHAVDVLRRCTVQEIQIGFEILIKNRRHAVLAGQRTETVLPQFKEIIAKVAGQEKGLERSAA